MCEMGPSGGFREHSDFAAQWSLIIVGIAKLSGCPDTGYMLVMGGKDAIR